MGCSASHPMKFVAHQQNPTSNSSSSTHSSSQLQSSPYYSFSDPSPTPVSRTLSLPTPLVHHPPQRKGDSNHFVSLTSTTYGSLLVMDSPNSSFNNEYFANGSDQVRKIQDFGNSEDPLSPDSVINTWELMEGLDEEEELNLSANKVSVREINASELVKSCEIVEHMMSKPLWKHLSEESLLSEMDTNVVSSYQKALLGRERGYEKMEEIDKPQLDESFESKDGRSLVFGSDESCCLLGGEDRIVLYYTSLRVIRKTYEDCCAVRVIFGGFRVCVDERDISMDRSYRRELQNELNGKAVSLPQVFIKGKHIGGVEEIKMLHENGELARLLEGFPVMDLGFVCGSCGDARFVLCPSCSGSRKVYVEEEGELKRCPDCNENGLIRCSGCCP